MTYLTIRPARHDDAQAIARIDDLGTQMFEDIGMPIANLGTPSIDGVGEFIDAERAWVAQNGDGVCGLALVDIVDGGTHIEEVAIDPALRGQGIGVRLIDHVDAWSASQGRSVLTLRTYRSVPWNAPYYERLGFAVMAADELGAGLQAVARREAEWGLDRWPRVFMRRDVGVAASVPG